MGKAFGRDGDVRVRMRTCFCEGSLPIALDEGNTGDIARRCPVAGQVRIAQWGQSDSQAWGARLAQSYPADKHATFGIRQ